ncbi:MAG: PorT family protein [Balneolaceae bacterium]|nr:PorT family protein [Balneolaceae bacterium]
MKQVLQILASLLLIVAFASQQSFGQIGVKGGVNLSKFVGSDAAGADDVMGLNIGLTFRLFGIGPVSIHPEIYYSEKGTRFSDQASRFMNMNPDQFNPDDFENFDLEFNLAYVEVPVMVKLTLPFISTNVVKPFVTGGPVFAWRVDCNFSLETTESISVQDCANQNFPDLETTFKDADRGFAFGGGLDFVVPILGTFIIEGRYTRGLARLRETGVNDDIQNQSFTLLAGFTLGF